MRNWEKIGYFHVPCDRYPWMHSHAQLPSALPLSDTRVRVFFASRSSEQHSHVAFTDLVFSSNRGEFKVERISEEPVLSPGEIGCFDQHGVFPSCIVPHENKYYMYFIGWNRGFEAPLFYASIGLAVSEDGVVFRRHSLAPILSRSEFDPCLVTSPHVYVENGLWRMTYVSGVRWTRNTDGRLQSHYHIKAAHSNDPFNWEREGQVVVDFNPGETNVARSAVLKDRDGRYRMWFSFVHSDIGKYRIGYAESPDGATWQRRDELAGIDVGDDFAKEMICYPCVFRLGDDLYMLFNGDNFGAAGFGIAKARKH